MKVAIALLFLVTTPAWAEEDISAAGRLELVGRGGTCSAVLVAPDLIATAAHCVIGRDQVFRPGDGLSKAILLVSRFVTHPLYDQASLRLEWKLRFDIAVGRLAKPVPQDRAHPLPIGDEAQPGETLLLVSWRNDGTAKPRKRFCKVLDGVDGLVTLDCPVQGGESGAPVLRKAGDGYELVAIVSSKARHINQPVAQASNVRIRLQPLFDELNNSAP